MLDKEIKKNWVYALRSGDYNQGTGRLKKYSYEDDSTYHCCLGVLCEIAYGKDAFTDYRHGDYKTIYYTLKKDGFSRSVLSEVIRADLGIDTGIVEDLIRKNDDFEWSFDHIATFIENSGHI